MHLYTYLLLWQSFLYPCNELTGGNAITLVNLTHYFFLCHSTLNKRVKVTNYNIGFLCNILYKYLLSSRLRGVIGCFVVPLLNGTGFLFCLKKFGVENSWYIFASSSRRVSTCISGVVRLGEELKVWHASQQVTNVFVEYGHMWEHIQKAGMAPELLNYSFLLADIMSQMRHSVKMFESISGHF